MKLIIVATLWMLILNGMDERPHKQMHSMDEVPSGEREVHYTEDGSGWYEYYD